ncbi:MAG: hypothetical protein GY799_27290 [Desulfobulbaceae bacterium]|nr:hypothetical protein [Desulfobulbaceae bacterium]
MDRLKYLVIGILALLLSGCGRGQIVVETLNVAEGPTYNAPGNGKSIVLLPFADYSKGNRESAQRRNLIITEALTDRLLVNGFSLPIQEDVVDYLITENFISANDSTSSVILEQNTDWSEQFKHEINTIIEQAENENNQINRTSQGIHGLSTKQVAEIGQHFNADYIVRGRILEYKGRGKTDSVKIQLPVWVDEDATVEMRVWIQETATASVIWSNRINVKVAPESVSADSDYDTLSNRAIDKGATTLVDHFVAYGL